MPPADEDRFYQLARAWALREAGTLRDPRVVVRLDDGGEVLVVVEGADPVGRRTVGIGKGQLAALKGADSEAVREWATILWLNPDEMDVVAGALGRPPTPPASD